MDLAPRSAAITWYIGDIAELFPKARLFFFALFSMPWVLVAVLIRGPVPMQTAKHFRRHAVCSPVRHRSACGETSAKGREVSQDELDGEKYA